MAAGENKPINNLLDKKNEHRSPYFLCILSKNFGVLTMKIAVIRSEKIGAGPGKFTSLDQLARNIGCGICAYSAGRGAL